MGTVPRGTAGHWEGLLIKAAVRCCTLPLVIAGLLITALRQGMGPRGWVVGGQCSAFTSTLHTSMCCPQSRGLVYCPTAQRRSQGWSDRGIPFLVSLSPPPAPVPPIAGARRPSTRRPPPSFLHPRGFGVGARGAAPPPPQRRGRAHTQPSDGEAERWRRRSPRSHLAPGS